MYTTFAQTSFIKLSRILLIPTILVMLFVGLHQKGYDSTNHLRWNSQKGGFSFSRNSIAFTGNNFNFPGDGESFAIDLLIEPDYPAYPSFQFILLVYGKSDADQLLVGQWDRSLVVMNGNDYSNGKHTPKLYIPLGLEDGKKHVRITSTRAGVKVLINGQMAQENKQMVLTTKESSSNCRLVLGNSITARNPWYGTLYDLKIYEGEQVKPGLHYNFTKNAKIIRDEMERGPDIQLPTTIPVLHKRILLWPNFGLVNRALLLFDIFINIFGFVPLGILLSIFLYSFKDADSNFPLFLSFFLIAAFSLTIEMSQIYIPSRHSSLLDLVLNVSGGLVGILIAERCMKQKRRVS